MDIDDHGAINGNDIDVHEIDGSAFVLDVEASHAFAFAQLLNTGGIKGLAADHSFRLTQLIDSGRVKSIAASHSFRFDQQASTIRVKDMAASHTFTVNQALVLGRMRAMAADHSLAFSQTTGLGRAIGLEAGHDFAFEQAVESISGAFGVDSHMAFALQLDGQLDSEFIGRWEWVRRVVVPLEDRAMQVAEEPVRETPLMVLPRESRLFAVKVQHRRIVIPREPVVLVRQKHKVIA
jgi:hypothetical protein